jgi:cytochrome c peroxidase
MPRPTTPPRRHSESSSLRTPESDAGVAPVDRNAPALALAAHNRWQFWDGRADTLWMQALGPFENAKDQAHHR